MNILITGGTGFLGRNFNDFLNKKNNKIKLLILSRYTQKKNNYRFIKTSLRISKKSYNKIVNFKPNILLNFAWEGIPNFSKQKCKKNLSDQKHFLSLVCKIDSIKKIISIGSCSEYKKKFGECREIDEHNLSNPFSKSKVELSFFLKNLCKKKNIKFIWLRIFYIFGPYQKSHSLIPTIISSIKKKKDLQINKLNNQNDFIYVKDACNLIYRFFFNKVDSGIYNIGSGKLTKVITIINKLYQNYGIKKNISCNKFDKNIYASQKKIRNNFKKFQLTKLDTALKETIKYF
jgi:nucleoside-diphosphate-sugar epimerase